MLAAGDTVVSHYQAQCLIPAGTWIDQFRIPHDRWIQGLITHLYRVSLDLKKIFISTGEKVTRIWKLNNTQSCKQVISLNLWIFYFRSRLTLYKYAVSVFIQLSWRIQNWTIGYCSSAQDDNYRLPLIYTSGWREALRKKIASPKTTWQALVSRRALSGV